MKPKYISFTTACRLIQKGEIVAVPTETVYGLAGSVFSESALKKIFHIKKRPLFNPLIVHCADIKQMNCFHKVKNSVLQKMITHFSPGPLTFILNKTNSVHPLITGGQDKVALRIPRHPVTLRLIKETTALCAPSANLFGQLSPTRANHVYSVFEETVPILDGGECKGGIESTVLEPDFENKQLKILRPGLVSKGDLQKWLKKERMEIWEVITSHSSVSPGQSEKHYRPAVPMVLIEVYKAPIPTQKEVTKHLQRLFPESLFRKLTLKSSAILSARILYHEINILSQNPNHVIYVIKNNKNKDGAWTAIWNRLNKACSKRIKWPLNPDQET